MPWCLHAPSIAVPKMPLLKCHSTFPRRLSQYSHGKIGRLLASIARQLPPSPMRVFARWIEFALYVPVQRSHHSDPREHRRAAQRRGQDQSFHRCLPWLGVVFSLGQFGDVESCLGIDSAASVDVLDLPDERGEPIEGFTGKLRNLRERWDHRLVLERCSLAELYVN